MTRFLVRPHAKGSIKGSVIIPPSKSHTLRAILFAAMAKGDSQVKNYLHSPDTTAMIEAMRAFGAKIKITADCLEIHGLAGKLHPPDNVIDAGNSGQVLRFVGALAALSPAWTVITGDHSIRHNRPVKPLLSALSQLGALATSSRLDGYAPILIRGPMQSGRAQLSGEDSQPVSGLLIAASFLSGKTILEVTDPGEKPWIDLTLHWLHRFGIRVTHEDYARYTIPGNAQIDAFHLVIPGDFSSAAFPVALALVTDSEITLNNIDMDDCQGDKKLIDVLIAMGAHIEIDRVKKILHVRKGSKLQGIPIDVNDFIDATPILSVIGCFAEGTTVISGASIARQKESDRLHAMTTELKKMGALIEEKPDGLIISHSLLKGAELQSWRDHRIAMSLFVAAMGATGDSQIDGAECVAKTYPGFDHDMRLLGASIEAAL